MICQAGACVPHQRGGVCSGDIDCLCGQPCEDIGGGIKFCGCTNAYFCPLGQVCDLATRACKAPPTPCQSAIDCPWGAGAVPYRCIHNQCVACPGVETACYGSDANCTGACSDGRAAAPIRGSAYRRSGNCRLRHGSSLHAGRGGAAAACH